MYMDLYFRRSFATFFQGYAIPTMTMYTEDYIEEALHDVVLAPAPGVLTFSDLGLVPQRIDYGVPIEHVRHFRVGGYEFGTESASSGTI